jgi:Hydrazine synthase alpha subunit middle domain
MEANMKKVLTRMCALACVSAAASALLVGCGSGSSGDGDSTVTVQGDVPLAYVKRSTALSMNPTDGAPSAPGGDLMVREKSSPSAPEHNITAAITQGVGDASDPEVSYNGKKIVFALRCPASNTSMIGTARACTGRWNIWEYDMTTGGLTGGSLRRITSSNLHDDADPAYLPAGGGFVFSSNRQTKSMVNQALGQTYKALDEYEREAVMNLHTMDVDGGDIRQISFNQSHDRNPVVRPNGDIMFSRWEHVGDRNRFAVFRAKPDGTDMFVLYGAQSPGNSFLHPRDMDPSGPYKGYMASSLMPLSRTQEGGAMMVVDAFNYSENNTRAFTSVPERGGQSSITEQRLSDGGGLSEFGRVTTPYPLWDGTNRILLSYRPCEVTRNGVVVACVTLTDAEKARVGDRNRMAADVAADPLRDNAPAAYAVYMFNPANQTWRIVAAPPPGFMYTDPIPLQARSEPNAAQPTAVDAALAAQGLALIEVRSVYDTDGLGRMGEGMLVASDLPAGCARGIAMTTPPAEPTETRTSVANLVRMKDPADPAYKCSPVRFVRATRAVAPPSGMTGLRGSIGETEFEQQQILGYAPVEPDGSFKLHVPADTPIALSIIDTKGRAIQTHTNWIQVRPGERRTCDGCHSPRRGGSLNSGVVVNTMPAALVASLASAHESGETMASTRTKQTPALLALSADPSFTDAWADPAQARPDILVRYTGNANPADDLATPAPATTGVKRGIVNFRDHVAPLFTRSRPVAGGGNNQCTACHADPVKLDLRDTVAGTGRVTSYEEVIMGDPVIDPATGLPQFRIEDGVPMIVRGAALVETSSSFANSAGGARKSRLTEIMFGETLLAGAGATTAHPNPPGIAPNHATMLNAAEKRVLTEWMDLGGQYYNDPFDPAGGVRAVNGLSETVFETTIQPILRSTCAASCHQAIGSDQTTPAGASFRQNRFVLTGSAEGDYGVTLSMISDTCNAASSYLLSRPSTAPHPAGATTQTVPVLPAGSANYNTIAAWIATGC